MIFSLRAKALRCSVMGKLEEVYFLTVLVAKFSKRKKKWCAFLGSHIMNSCDTLQYSL